MVQDYTRIYRVRRNFPQLLYGKVVTSLSLIEELPKFARLVMFELTDLKMKIELRLTKF